MITAEQLNKIEKKVEKAKESLMNAKIQKKVSEENIESLQQDLRDLGVSGNLSEFIQEIEDDIEKQFQELNEIVDTFSDIE